MKSQKAGRREFKHYKAWRWALRRECPSVEFWPQAQGLVQAYGYWLGVKKPCGQWAGNTGVIEYPR